MESAYTPSESVTTLPELYTQGVLSREETRIDELPVAIDVVEATSVVPIGQAHAVGTPEKYTGDSESLKTLHEEILDPNGLEDQTNYLPARMVIVVFMGVSLSLALAWLESTIVATALPSITSSLQGGKESSWVASAYLMSSLAFTPVFGRWSDIFGRKKMLMIALLVFFIFSIACALAQTMTQLIIFRALQGVGGGAIMTVAIIIPNDVVSLRERSKYQGIIETVSVISNGCGPIIGGALSQYTSWRWAFWINLPLAALAMVITYFFLPLKPVHGDWRVKAKQVDYGGSALTIIAAILVMLGINWGGVTYPWTSPQVLAPLIIGILTFAVFLGWEAKVAKIPIIPLSTFRYRTLNGVLIATLLNGMTFITILFYLPQFLQLVNNKSPLNASLLLVPFLGTIGFSVITAGLITTYSGGHYKAQIVVGYSCWTIAQGLLSTLNERSSSGKIIGILALAGVSAGMTFQTQLLASQACIPRHEQAVVAGVRSFVRSGGTTIALAINASIVNNILRKALNPLSLTPDQVTRLLNDPTLVNSASLELTSSQREGAIEGYTRGFRAVFYMTTACMALATLASIFMIGQHTLEREDDKAQEEKMREAERKRVERKKRASMEARSSGEVEKGLGGGMETPKIASSRASPIAR